MEIQVIETETTQQQQFRGRSSYDIAGRKGSTVNEHRYECNFGLVLKNGKYQEILRKKYPITIPNDKVSEVGGQTGQAKLSQLPSTLVLCEN